ncbi:hypothetical protein FUAX_25980 [Fulvitalea axinellae]|uniref:DUF2961 domain-containing protein n=1 Tax=Fulvitalea axinellae TaxID=1182444 RepID=A0AAU9DAY6_9BACT|nr:hypothetical protein FUAX_25980 [Fulvitalea axinellae]
MKIVRQAGALLMALMIFTACTEAPKRVTFESLLHEMVDRDAIASFPEKEYRCLQASSYNRESVSPDKPGWFADSDGIGFIRTEENDGRKEWVLMEDDGPGAITKIWAVCFYYGLKNTTGANIRIYLDGAEKPAIEANFFELVKGQDFVKAPLADESTRAGNLYMPIPYAKSCKVTMDNKAFYNIINYRSYPKGTDVETFSMDVFTKAKKTVAEVSETLEKAPVATEGKVLTADMTINPGNEGILTLPKGSKAVKALEIEVEATNHNLALRSTVMKANFDGERTVWTPVGDFFNNGPGKKAYHMWERTVTPEGKMICRWAMPYKTEGNIAFENFGKQDVKVKVRAIVDDWEWTDRSMHFHANWRMDPAYPTFPIFDWNLVEVKGKGVFVGDQWTVLNPRQGWWGEGDEKVYVDGDFQKNFPSHFGTGTEDYYGWAGGVVPTPADEFSKPFLGNVLVGNPRAQGYNTCSRTRSLDAIPFKERIKFDFEASCGTRKSWHRLQYSANSYWYAIPGAKSNRNPLPEMASATTPTLADIQAEVEEAKSAGFVVDGALECENLSTFKADDNVTSDKKISVWGEISNGAMKSYWFQKKDEAVSVKITEQFEKRHLNLCAAVGPAMGVYDIYVNGKLKVTQDFSSNHGGMTTPYVDLGVCEPVDNAFDVKFVLKKNKRAVKKKEARVGLGLDFFLLK